MATRENNQPKSVFLVLITGEIEYAELLTVDNLYCKYFYVHGSDWRQISGLEEGISPTSQKGRSSQRIVLNTPLEATFSSTNPFRWPQIVVCCYGHDAIGNDCIRGYGSVHLPTVSGRTTRNVAVFVPEASTTMHKILGFFTGRRAEFIDPRIVSMSEGRDVTRVRTQGYVKIGFNTILKDLKKFGYDNQPIGLSKPSEFPLSNFQNSIERHSPINALMHPSTPANVVAESPKIEEQAENIEIQERLPPQIENDQTDDQIIEEIEEVRND